MLDVMVLIVSLPVIDLSKHNIRLSNLRSASNIVTLMVLISYF